MMTDGCLEKRVLGTGEDAISKEYDEMKVYALAWTIMGFLEMITRSPRGGDDIGADAPSKD